MSTSLNNRDDNDATIIDEMVSLAEQLRHRPKTRLLPYLPQLGQLVSTTDDLYHSISSATRRRSKSTSSVSKSTPQRSSARSRQVNARDAFNAAVSIAPSLATSIRQHFASSHDDWMGTAQDPRAIHLQPILSLQKAPASSYSDTRDRLLLATSCSSLATDFEQYETNNGWTSKHQTLLQRIKDGQDTAVHQNGQNHQAFLTTVIGQHTGKEKFDAGLRLGTKTRLVETLGEMSGLGPAVGLLMGYECRKLSRMPYREFPAFLNMLQDKASVPESVVEFCSEFNMWWRDLRSHYHSKYGM
jgi:hypothetical protein